MNKSGKDRRAVTEEENAELNESKHLERLAKQLGVRGVEFGCRVL